MSSSESEAKKLAAQKKVDEERQIALARDAALAKREEMSALRLAQQKKASESSAQVIADKATTNTLLVAYKAHLEAKVKKGEMQPEVLEQQYKKASEDEKSTFTFDTHEEAVAFFKQQHDAGQHFLVLQENASGNLLGGFMLSYNDKFIPGKFKDPKTVEALEAQWRTIVHMPDATREPMMKAIILAMESNDDAKLLLALAKPSSSHTMVSDVEVAPSPSPSSPPFS